jgi:chromosome partitioning protein
MLPGGDGDSAEDPVTVVSVINYKGGVGKTTITANLGAELAFRGLKVLLIDLDAQASLTFSFYRPDYWEKELADEHTILQWYGSVLSPGPTDPLRKYVLEPPAVNAVIRSNGIGQLDLLASHLGLVEVDLDFAHLLGGSRFQHGSPNYLPIHRCLADALADEAFAEYDVILLDCAPNFTMVTRTGIVASDHILVPTKPDYLSTLGIDYLRRKVSELVRDYSKAVPSVDHEINPQMLGIVFTMIQYAGLNPIIAMRNYLAHPALIQMPMFQQTIRDNKTVFGTVGEQGIPAVLAAKGNEHVQYELRELASEFLAKIRI